MSKDSSSLAALNRQALAGKPLAVGKNRGPITLDGRPGYLTIHPSFLLRRPEEDKARAWKDFVADLRRIRELSGEKLAA